MPDQMNVYVFVIQTGLLTTYFIMCGILQWMLLCLYMKHGHIVYTMICFFAALVLLTVIHYSESLKIGKPWSYVAILLCYELLTLGVASFIVDSSASTAIFVILGALFIWAAVLAGCYAIIWYFDYPSPYLFGGAGVVGLMLAMSMVAVEQVLDSRACGEITLLIVMLSVIFMMVSHVLLTNDNLAVLTKQDTLLVAFVLYLNYVIIMALIFVFVIRHRRYKEVECKHSCYRKIDSAESTTTTEGDIWDDD